MARPKKNGVVELSGIDDCTRVMGELLVAITDIETLTAERDLAVAAAQKPYESRLDEAVMQRDAAKEALRTYYITHLAELEKGGVKHVQLPNGIMGRRDNPAKLAPKNRSWTWSSILIVVRAAFGDRFLRVHEPELDKDLIKAEMTPAQLDAHGMKLQQDETFYAEPARLPAPGKE